MQEQKVYLVGDIKEELKGNKLPSIGECLSVLFFNIRAVKLSVQDSASLVIDECLVFWKKACIPTHDHARCVKKLRRVYDDWRNLDKSKLRKRCLTNAENMFIQNLDKLFDIAHADALNVMTNYEDKQFLLAQRKEGRPGYMQNATLDSSEREIQENEQDATRKRKAETQLSPVSGKLALALSLSPSIAIVFL